MITSDLHTHTNYSHGLDSVLDMYRAAIRHGLSFLGFSEHSLRPEGYAYPAEYRDNLRQGLPAYVQEVRALQDLRGKNLDPGNLTALFGMEVDWIGAEPEFVRQAATAYDFDYLIGSVHFLGRWGFDSSSGDWEQLDKVPRHTFYAAYFAAVADMAGSGLFQIAGHFDLIKIFSVRDFQAWLTGDNLDLVRDALAAVRDAGMAMEVSSAGLRKPCAEIYPGPAIMRLAADLQVPIAFASDAHAADQVAWAFPELATYAASFGYGSSLVFRGKDRIVLELE